MFRRSKVKVTRHKNITGVSIGVTSVCKMRGTKQNFVLIKWGGGSSSHSKKWGPAPVSPKITHKGVGHGAPVSADFFYFVLSSFYVIF